MMLFGFIAANMLPSVVQKFDEQWSVYVRNLAQCFILMRGGMGMNLNNLRPMKGPLLLLSFLPQVTDALVVALLCVYAMDIPLMLALATGFMLSAVSPAIVVPMCIKLKEYGFGNNKSIQDFLICVTSIDNVTALVSTSYTVFGIFSSIGLEALSGGSVWFGDPTLAAIVRAPIVVIGGILLGLATGFGLTLLTPLHWIVYFLSLLTLSLGYVFIALAYSMSGLAYIAVLLACIISVRSREPHEQKLAAMVMLTGWKVLEIILFALIGAAIDLNRIDGQTAWMGVVLTVVGVGVKIPAAFFFFKGNLNVQERIYCTMCRLPKATIQASLGGVVLAIATAAKDSIYMEYGHKILTCAAFSIILTAPMAAVISTWAPKLLTCDQPLIQATTSVKPVQIMNPLMQMRNTHSLQKQQTHKD